MQSCFGFLFRPDGTEKNASTGVSANKPGQEKMDLQAVPVSNFDSFSSSTALNHAADSSQASDFYLTNSQREAHISDNENDTKIDLDVAIRAVDLALAGLHVGGKRQGSPTASKPEVQAPTPTRSRPGVPPRAAVLPKAIRRFARFVTTNPQQRAPFQDAFTNMQQVPYPTGRQSSQDFMLNSGDMLNAQFSGYFPNAAEMRSNFSESDMQNAAALWGSHTSEEWNMQQQLQNLINSSQTLNTATAAAAAAQNGVGRNWSADFAANPQLSKYMTNNAISEFLMNSSDSWSSKIEVPHQGSGRGDSFSSKIEFPINCDSFTSKLSVASVRDDSFSSQRLVEPLMLNRTVEPQILDPAMEAAYSMPEVSLQELESLAEGDDTKEVPETANIGVLTEAHSHSEKNLLLRITEILRHTILSNVDNKRLLYELNELIVSVRRHLMDFQNFSSSAAEAFLLVGSTLPVICLTSGFSDDVLASLQKFMMMISSGHPSLKNAACLMEINPAKEVKSNERNEAFQLLTKMQQKLNSELSSNSNPATSSPLPQPQPQTQQQQQIPLTSHEMPSSNLNVGLVADVSNATSPGMKASEHGSESSSEVA